MEFENNGQQGFYVGNQDSQGLGSQGLGSQGLGSQGLGSQGLGNQGYPEQQYSTPQYTTPPIQNNPTTGAPRGRTAPISGWNWGAFMMCPIWGIANKCYITLLAFLPIANIIMPFLAGYKGNEWALHSGLFTTVEEFNGAQRTWNRAGKFMLGLFLGLLALYAVIGVFTFIIFAIAGN